MWSVPGQRYGRRHTTNGITTTSPSSAWETALRLELDLRFELYALLADVIVFEPKRVGQLDKRVR